MAKLVKVYDTGKDMDILINIDSISVIDLMHRDIILNNCTEGFRIINVDNKSIKDIYNACGYYETPTRQIEGEWEQWGRFDDVRIWSSPRKYTPEEATDPNLVIGTCECCAAQPYGHVFKKTDFPNGEVKYKCVICGAECGLTFNPVNNKNS